MIYILGLCFILFLSLIKHNKRNDKIFMIVTALVCLLIMGLRSSSVGTDSTMYFELYNLEISGSTTALTEKAPLYIFILKNVTAFFPNWNQIYFFFTALIVITFVWCAIALVNIPCREAIIMYYLLFFLDSLNGTRTYVAASLVFFAFALTLSKYKCKMIFASFIIMAATFIHNVALSGFIIIAMELLDLSDKKIRRVVIGIMALSCLLITPAISIFIRFFPVYSGTLQRVTDTVGASAIIFQVIFIACVFEVIYCLKCGKDYNPLIDKKSFDILSVLSITELIFYIAGGTLWYIQRILIFMEMPVLLIYPVLSKINCRYRKLFKSIVWIVALFVFFYRIFRNLGNVRPYKFYWQ